MKVSTPGAEISLEQLGFIRVKMTDDFVLKIVDAQKIASAAVELAAGKLYPVLIELGNNASEDREVREYFATAGGRYSKLDAIVVGSPMQKLTAKLYVKLNHPTRQTRIFNRSDEAIDWLIAESSKINESNHHSARSDTALPEQFRRKGKIIKLNPATQD